VRSKYFKNLLSAAVLAALLAGCGSDEAPPADSTAQPAEQAPAQESGVAPVAQPPDAESGTQETRRRLMDSVVQQEWVPELVANPGESTADMLRRAADARAAGRLEQGENNALSLYMAVLEQEPNNAEATTAIDEVVAELVARGERTFTQGRFNEAARIAQAVARVRPNDEAVVAFRAKVDAGREVALLLAEAQRLAAAGRTTAPAGENALAIYRDILQNDPGNSAAQQGIAKLESDLVAQAMSAAESGDYEASERFLAEAGQVQPGSQAVQNASARIVEMRGNRTAPLIAQANQAIDAKQFDRAAELIAQIEQVSAQAQGIEELRQKLENARTYSAMRPGQAVTDTLSGGGRGPEMVVLPLGSFVMGSPEGESDRKGNEGPTRTVTLKQAFAMARHETTVAQFRAFVRSASYTPTSARNNRSTIYDERAGQMGERGGVTWESDHSGNPADGNLPVVHVSWTDAKAYANWLSQQTGQSYRLPSEAEFEYALRAGGQTRYWWGDSAPDRVVGNLTGERDRSASGRNWVNAFDNYGDGFWGNAPVGSFEANRFGLHDMGGNVSEWVEDCWHENYQRAPSDGSAWVNEGCNRRVIRGASWASAPDQARSAFRLTAGEGTTNARLGFRVARDL
jgi:formylglycine-generating enzyme required for sulfatase activity